MFSARSTAWRVFPVDKIGFGFDNRTEIALHENVDAAGIIRNAVLGEGAAEQVALAALALPEVGAEEDDWEIAHYPAS